MAGFLGFCDLMKYEMSLGDEACFKYTGSKLKVSIKHAMSYIFFFIPETFFLFFFYPINVIFVKWFFNVQLLRFFSETLKLIKDIFELPWFFMTCYYGCKKGVPETVLLEMWENPFVPYVAIAVYRQKKGIEDPPYPVV